MKDLIIVESPTKSKTLTSFLGKGYKVLSTMGHIRDLPKEKLGIEIVEKKDKNYDFLPQYALLEKKKETIKKLKEETKKAKKVYLATDPDREGEAISYHVAYICSKKKEKDPKFLRITFHEITQKAIKDSLKKAGKINLQLVDAQQARRLLDRLVGYKLSPLLWRKIRRGLSAGRVQSVAVRLIVEREREREKFIPEEYWDILAHLRKTIGGKKEGAPTFYAKLIKKNSKSFKIDKEIQAKEVVKDLEKANYEVGSVERKEVLQDPPPPFSTSTLQQIASRRLGFSGKRTMRAAQSLYERGFITYHRTDSFNLASQAISEIRNYIEKEKGKNYLPEKPRIYKTKSKVAQEAHEAVRPTNVNRQIEEKKAGRDEQKLYRLIWQRAVASQIKAAIWDQAKINIQAPSQRDLYGFLVEGKVIKFDGWLSLYKFKDKEKEEELPSLKKGDDLDLLEVKSEQKFTQSPARYTEASLIKALEERGIGRPSTYVPIISTIQNRQYVEKEERKFKPTPLGEVVNDFLIEYFPQTFDYQFTAKMEDELDDIANGKRNWISVMNDFYLPFEEKLKAVTEVAERVQVPTEVTGEKCPECKKGELVIRVGRFGKFISCSRFPDCKYTAPFVQKIEGIKCPKCGGEVVVKKTKKGKQFYGCSNYPKCDWASWKKPKK